MKTKIIGLSASLGEILVVIGAAIWITGWIGASYVFVVGTILFAVGRLLEKHPESQNIVLNRLYKQQSIGIIMLVISAGMMLFYPYQRTAWLIPFIIFVVAETYSAFRIPAELEKDKKNKTNNYN